MNAELQPSVRTAQTTHPLLPSDEHVNLLPVSMIENHLLDRDSNWEATQSVLTKRRWAL